MDRTHRVDAGHFQYTAEAFRHWDEGGEVEAGCAKCHSAEGLPFLLEHGVSIAQEPIRWPGLQDLPQQLAELRPPLRGRGRVPEWCEGCIR